MLQSRLTVSFNPIFQPLLPAWLLFLTVAWAGSAGGQSLPSGPLATSASAGTDAPETTDVLSEVDSLRKARAFREALRRLHRLKTERPDDVAVHYRLAVLWSDLGKDASDRHRTVSFYRQSLEAAEAALETDPESGWAHLAVALAHGRLTLHASTRERVERSQAVKTHADRAIDLDSTLAGAYHLRGRWHQEVASLNAMVRAVVRIVYGGLPEASYEQSVADFQQALDLETRTYHHLELGKTYRKMGRPNAAREQFRAALAAPSVDPFAPEHKAEARTLIDELR